MAPEYRELYCARVYLSRFKELELNTSLLFFQQAFLTMLQTAVHYSLHFLVIGLIAYLYDRRQWKKYWLILLSTMLVDLDHLLADPVFLAGRCSIGFHPLHSEILIGVYFLGAIFIKHRILKLIFIGLLFHMITDTIDCIWMFSNCTSCEIPEYLQKIHSLF